MAPLSAGMERESKEIHPAREGGRGRERRRKAKQPGVAKKKRK